MGTDAASERRERFTLKRLIGTGATGMVYEALDSAREATVALKILHRVEPEALFQFKAEFRSLSHLAHPNLLQLYELTTRDDEYVLSMELVDGGDFYSHVRGLSRDEEADDELDEDTAHIALEELQKPSLPANDVARPSLPMSEARPPLPARARNLGTLDESKLRHALRQLAEGLHALHRSGHLHRDLKPANVLVFRTDARVVLCDFGLVVKTETQRLGATHGLESGDPHATGPSNASTHGNKIAGSLAFMSPEQASGAPLDRATDWYAVGVMLYQALAGRVPFEGRPTIKQLVRAKHEETPPDPRTLEPTAPADLAELALALLERDPARRAGYADVVKVLDHDAVEAVAPASLPPELLIGRERQLEQLARAFANAQSGHATVASVWGFSGMGKSAVARRFLRECEERHGALVLRARCYECEELPYKVFDPLLDALSQYLVTRPSAELAAILPDDTYFLAALFPALRRVDAIAALPSHTEVTDLLERKRRAFRALRELCRRLSQQRPVVLYVDDLQWGDVDSGQPLFELLREPDAPPILFIGAYRAEDARRSPLLRELRGHYLPLSGLRELFEVEVGSLAPDEARALAAALLGDRLDAEASIEHVVTEARGSPFFLRALASYLRARGHDGVQALSLDAVIQEHVDTLSHDARTLLELLAVAGRPESRDVVQRATGLGARMFATAQVLEAQNLLNSTGTQASDKLEPYHDRVREALYGALGEERRQTLHRALADALEESADRAGVARDAETLLHHLRAARDGARTAHYAVLAADKALESLAFLRAAALFREAVTLCDEQPARKSELEEKLGNALMFAGRGAEAADAFLRARADASPQRAADLRAMAMVQLLGAGHLRRAYDELTAAEDELGMRFPRTNLRAIWMLLTRKLRMKLDDKSLRVLPNAAIDQAALRRVDDLYKVATALSTVDFLRGGAYTAEMTLRALKTGDASRLACALAVESARSASNNEKPAQTQWIIERAAALAQASGELYPLAASRGTEGVSRYLEGRFREAIPAARESQRIHRELLNGTRAWDYWTMVLFELRAAAELGDLPLLIARVPETIRDAEERGDLYVKNMARVARLTWAWLAPDQLDVAREQVALAEREWVQDGYQLMHYYRLMSCVEIALYDGSREACEAAYERLQREWKPMKLVRKIQTCRVQALYMRARLALVLAKARNDPRLARHAQRDAHELVQERTPWAAAIGQLVQGCAASFASPTTAAALFDTAAQAFAAEQLAVYAAAARAQAGRLRGDEQAVQATEQLRARGVAAPERFVQMLAPAVQHYLALLPSSTGV